MIYYIYNSRATLSEKTSPDSQAARRKDWDSKVGAVNCARSTVCGRAQCLISPVLLVARIGWKLMNCSNALSTEKTFNFTDKM